MSASDVVAGRLSTPRTLRRERLLYPLAVLALAGAYYGAAEVVFALEVGGPVAAVVWLPVGVGIAALYLGGSRLWPGVLIGDLLANDYGTLPVGTALLQTCGNLAEILIAAELLRRAARRGPLLGSIRGLMGVLGALAAGTVVSATVGTLAQLAGGVIGVDEVPEVWRTWWLGDFTGALVIVPLAVAWSRRPPSAWLDGRHLEAGALLVAVFVLGGLATRSHEPLMYLMFPALIWAALRFGARGATLAIAVAVGFTVWNTSHFLGPFVFSSISDSVVSTPAVHRRGGAHHVLPRRRGLGARGVRGGPARVARAAGRGVRHRAPPDRAQPPRRRPAAAVGARGALPPRRREPAAAGGGGSADRARGRRAVAGDRGAARARARPAAGAADQARARGRDPEHRGASRRCR